MLATTWYRELCAFVFNMTTNKEAGTHMTINAHAMTRKVRTTLNCKLIGLAEDIAFGISVRGPTRFWISTEGV